MAAANLLTGERGMVTQGPPGRKAEDENNTPANLNERTQGNASAVV